MNLSSLLGLTFAERWSTGGITTLLGLGMTFVMLALLIGAIILLRYILKGLGILIPKCKEKFSRKKKTAEESTNEIVIEVDRKPEEEIDGDTMSAIEQAVRSFSANADDGKKHDRIRIVSVKEVKHD